MESKLVKAVIEMLRKRPCYLTYAQLEKDTGIPAGWIRRLKLGKINEPSGPRLETLWEYFTNKQLQV